MKYVYLIQSLETGFYKIGISKDPNKRIISLQTGNSSQLKLIYSYKSEYYNQIEKTLHRQYSFLKKHGEWFDLQLNDELNFLNNCKKIENNIIILKSNNNIFI